ncbi:RNA polymerase sigma factor [Ktedonobacter racemifer]|jgi:RNA polymerase sigma-70 factor (ECF subfamily)|uniref:RNA polymerase, sigma-24 subunit, ECF subfamily n=1 Tax=Ktedonobacter racemifer DSM 44963 TaxID=485913 RepID=D6TLQ8_KTERA|nr:RNA polymerase sigma factor [Ktedonobacter racemifer]EFH86708.1 RNA polymerase, sigma-24 subunit, ECF subfamily [Ktedonobacter racemifer DSM 44963]
MMKTTHAHVYAAPASLADDILLEHIENGDQAAFETLMQRYSAILCKFVYTHISDYEQTRDIVQSVFMQLYIYVPKLRANWSRQTSHAPLKSWLFQVAANRCTDELRKRRPLLFCELDVPLEDDENSWPYTIADNHPQPDEELERKDIRTALRRAILALPPRFRSIVLLRYQEELTFSEIGRILGMPENTAKTYFQRARPLLRAALTS